MTKKSIHLSIAAFVFCILGVSFTHNSSALTYSSNVEVGFTFNPTISINLSGDLLVNNLISGGAALDSNTIDVAVSTNATEGYTLTATAGTSTSNTDLINQTNSSYRFTSIATNASLASLTTDNTWGFSYSSDNGTNWSNYSGLPLDNNDEGVTGKQLYSTINPSDSKTIKFKIGAKASTSQPAGLYSNIINFYAVANPDPTLQPVSCPAGKICYNPNSLTAVVGEMGQQTTYTTEATLWAPNFKRSGYGFAGWADSTTYNGLRYGPNETIAVPDNISTEGYSLYAIWVKSAGDLQNWTGCSNLSQGEVTALKDTRDNNVYAVAKLADGKCWMIENLRLADKDSNGNDINLSNTTTHNPSLPLNNSWYYRDSQTTLTTSNHLSSTTDPTQTAWCSSSSSSCEDQSMLNTSNTTLFTNNTASSYDARGDVYSYGNYYNWYSATAGHGQYGISSGNVAGDICPIGWHLPTGKTTSSEFGTLDIVLGGTGTGSGPYTTPTGATMSLIYRSYPNNFIYSGRVETSIIAFKNTYGDYWSASWYETDYNRAYYMRIMSTAASAGANTNYKMGGLTVRCIAGV